MKSKNLTKLNIVLLLITIVLLQVLYHFKYDFKEKKVINITADFELSDTTTFSPSNLKKALKSLNVKYPDIVYNQAIIETGNFTSNIFKENNNLFGMKHPKVRLTTSIGVNRGHAKYNSWLDSVVDMVYFQNYYKFRIENVHTNYYDFLNDIYAEDENYIVKLKKMNYDI